MEKMKYCRIILIFWFIYYCSATPISSPGCEYAFGIYDDTPECSISYLKCAFGEPHQETCTPGLVYDSRIHGCNWPDLLVPKCNPEGELFLFLTFDVEWFLMNFLCVVSAVVGFKCPDHVDPHSISARFAPFPRYALPGSPHDLITCVEGYPRLISCGEALLNPESLTCDEPEKK